VLIEFKSYNSFGVVLWELATRRAPYDTLEDFGPLGRELRRRVQAGLRPDVEAVGSWGWGVGAALMQACWAENPSSRPTMAAVCAELWAMR
jgi:hypothetical protein